MRSQSPSCSAINGNIQALPDLQSLHNFVKSQKTAGKTIGLVPTMGMLHDGHLSLVKLAKQHCDVVIASIFVNPTQFGPNEDFDAYPRQLQRDIDLLDQIGCDAVYHPSITDIYPDGFATQIHVTGITDGLCGANRPGHFDGVALIVTKLLLQSRADIAVFGEKDYQQLCVIRQMVDDLNIPCRIIGGPIIRDEYGLALSSRNTYLSAEELTIARKINIVLADMVADITQQISQQTIDTPSKKSLNDILENGAQKLLDTGISKIDYLELRCAKTLTPITTIPSKQGTARLLTALKCGPARLLDNMAV